MPTDRQRVLVVEDEESLAESVRYNLEQEGYEVLVAGDGRGGLALARAERPDLLILDLMLPEMSGLDVCRIVRGESAVPIIMLTARAAEADVVAGLELGADDYVTKPFSMRELISRVRAQLRRMELVLSEAVGGDEVLVGGPVRLDVARHEATVRGSPVAFRPKEFALLELLLRRKGRLVARETLIEEIWGPHYFGDTKTLDVHVKRIRQKIEETPGRPQHLVTIRGLGYKFVDG